MQNPVVSVVVPARNEELCLGSCLESLVSQEGADFEIIVVDDASTDRTPEIARSFVASTPRVTLVSAPPLPDGWTGKNNAVTAGAKIAKGKWLLFTDADTTHKPGSLVRAVAEVEEHSAVLLSYSPEQEVHTLWEKAVMPVIFAELATTYPPGKVNDATSPIAAANGQYLLISRDAYDAVGGHSSIADSLLEDVALACRVKSSGRKIFFRYGGDAVRTRMYRSWPQMKEGWTKNLALLFPRPRRLAMIRGLEPLFIFGSGLTGVFAASFGRLKITSIAWSFALTAALWVWMRIRRAHFPRSSELLALVGLAIFSYLLLASEVRRKNGNITWKGRAYPSAPRKSGNS